MRPLPIRPASIGRYAIEDIAPVVALGTRPVKAVVGEAIVISANVFREGHDAVAATVVLRGPDGLVRATPMRPVDVDLWEAEVTADAIGAWTFTIEAWGDPVTTWRQRALIMIAADIDTELELREGADSPAAQVVHPSKPRSLHCATFAVRLPRGWPSSLIPP